MVFNKNITPSLLIFMHARACASLVIVAIKVKRPVGEGALGDAPLSPTHLFSLPG